MRIILTIVLLYFFNNPLLAESADEAMKRISTEQLEKIREKTNTTKSNHEHNMEGFVLSTHIQSFSDIGKDIDIEVKYMKNQIQQLIKSMATDIEINKGKSGVLTYEQGEIHYVPNPKLPQMLNDKREKLAKANVQNNVSIRSASMAFKLLSSINEELKKEAHNTKDRESMEAVYMKQAIFVYEMSDIVINLLDTLTLSGKENLETIYAETKAKAKKRVALIEKQKTEKKALADLGDISASQLASSLKGLDAMIQAQDTMLKSWDETMKKLGKKGEYLQNLKNKKRLLISHRETAKIQIETLRDFRTLVGIKDSIGSLDDLIDSVSNLDLLILDDKAVSKLLGIDF